MARTVEWPAPLRLEEVRAFARPCLSIRAPREGARSAALPVELSFRYEHEIVPAGHRIPWIAQVRRRRLLLRDDATESRAVRILRSLGFTTRVRSGRRARVEDGLRIRPERVPRAIRRLVSKGWYVEAEGKRCRRRTSCSLSITSGVDGGFTTSSGITTGPR